MKIVFMGTPDFAAVILEALLAWEGGEVVAVYTQPDRPAGRGKKLRYSAVKNLSVSRGLTVMQPLHFKDADAVEALRAFEADIAVVAAYGLILPQTVLDAPRSGCLNAHASLLPKYRGAAPIQRAIMAGEQVTGVTIMQMDAGMDTGPMVLQRAMAIGVDDTAGALHDELATLSATLMVEALTLAQQNALKPVPQDDARATYAPKLTKAEGEIDWARPARVVHDHVRGVTPWPGAFFFWDGLGADKPLRLTVLPGRVGDPLDDAAGCVEPGTIVGLHEGMLAVACADRYYLTPNLCPEGKCLIDAQAFCNGYLNRCAGS